MFKERNPLYTAWSVHICALCLYIKSLYHTKARAVSQITNNIPRLAQIIISLELSTFIFFTLELTFFMHIIKLYTTAV